MLEKRVRKSWLFFKMLLSYRILSNGVILVFTILFSSYNTFAQEEKSVPSEISIKYTSGHIGRHSNDIAHATHGYTNGFDIVARNLLPLKTQLNDRQQISYFDFGFHYIDYPKDYLGKTIAITTGKSGDLLKRNNFTIYGQFMYGLGFCTKPYSQQNNKNVALSTHIGFFFNANLSASYQFCKNWELNMGMAFNHLSNGGIKKPNKGYNVISTSMGVAYHLQERSFDTENYCSTYSTDSKKYYYHIIAAYFPLGDDSFSGKQYPSYHGHFQIERNLSLHHALLLSFDYQNSQKEAYPEVEKTASDSNNDHNYFGISAGANWKYSIFDFSVTTGCYLIRPWNVDKPMYNLINFKLYALKNKYILLGIKSQGIAAKAFEAGVGIKI
jgi:hypothetical protein